MQCTPENAQIRNGKLSPNIAKIIFDVEKTTWDIEKIMSDVENHSTTPPYSLRKCMGIGKPHTGMIAE